MSSGGISIWFATWLTSLSTGLSRLIAFIPDLLGAIVILLVGWGIGKVIQAVVTRGLLALHFEQFTQRAGINRALYRAEIQRGPSALLGVVAYWFVFLFAVQAAVNALGITALSTLISAVILYVPRIFGALLIVIAGAWLASVLADHARASARAAQLHYAGMLGTLARGATLFFACAIALDFLGVSFPFLSTAFAIILGGVTLAAALAFGLGGRQYAADVLAGRELRSVLHTGDHLATEQVEGTVQDIRPTLTIVRTKRGDVPVQNHELMEGLTRRPRARGGGENDGMSRAA